MGNPVLTRKSLLFGRGFTISLYHMLLFAVPHTEYTVRRCLNTAVCLKKRDNVLEL